MMQKTVIYLLVSYKTYYFYSLYTIVCIQSDLLSMHRLCELFYFVQTCCNQPKIHCDNDFD